MQRKTESHSKNLSDNCLPAFEPLTMHAAAEHNAQLSYIHYLAI